VSSSSLVTSVRSTTPSLRATAAAAAIDSMDGPTKEEQVVPTHLSGNLSSSAQDS
jgi:hypothetical protein